MADPTVAPIIGSPQQQQINTAAGTNTPIVNQTTNQLPNWYNQLALNFGSATNGALSNLSKLNNNWYSGPRVADFSGLQNSAFGAAGGAGTTGAQSYQPNFDAGSAAIGSGVNNVDSAATYDPNQMQQFMNPYTQGALSTLSNLGTRNLTENLLPAVNSTFTGAGQFGSSRNADFTNRAIRDTQDSINNAAGTMLNNSYGQAQNAYATNIGQNIQADNSQITGGGALAQLGINGNNQAWTNINNTQALGATQQGLQQKTLDTSYNDWLAQLQQPLSMLSSLSSTIPNFGALYRPNTTTVQATQPQASTGASNASGALAALQALLSGG